MTKGNDFLPVTKRLERLVPPDMVIPEYDFGPEFGVQKAVSIRNFLIFLGVTEQEMQRIDQARAERGLPPLFAD